MDYNIDNHLSDAYRSFPEGKRFPVIGITGNYNEGESMLGTSYYEQVVRAGGTPVIIPPVADKDVIISILDRIDGLILSGGADFNPLWAGEQPSPLLGRINAQRDLPELMTIRLAANRQIPMLGICRGMQALAMALGGKVMQDISGVEGVIKHSQVSTVRSEQTHTVCIEPDSILESLYGECTAMGVNSFHHQAVSDVGTYFRVTAKAPDGIIEAMECAEHKPIMGVQWHPECLGDDGLPLFRWIVDEAALFARVRSFHSNNITLDTHCDTPMFFPQDVDFGQRDPRILVDLHKMSDGMQDATTMVAYIPQKAELQPKEYADGIFDRIEKIVAEHSDDVALAYTPADLSGNKTQGRRSIMIGIENGRAIEGSIDNLRHFAERGIVYMTLCHNGDNDICDSAKGEATHGGLSPFGREVVKEMNNLGVMVDLSHAAESSFYDALELSRVPIVCSHSSCRALCDHPRNLTDEQMRALAQKGGVCQITIYNGFLRTDGKSTIMDVIDHVDHAVKVMGIDHVGLGTDFDGDGGVPGCADSSELPNFTRELMRRGYSDEGIRKIWGGNWLRVMQIIQNEK